MGYSGSRRLFTVACAVVVFVSAQASWPDEVVVLDGAGGDRGAEHGVPNLPPSIDGERVIVLCKSKSSAIDRYQKKARSRGAATGREAQEAREETDEELADLRANIGLARRNANAVSTPEQDNRGRPVFELRSTACGLAVPSLEREQHRRLAALGYEIVSDAKVSAFLSQSVTHMKSDATSLSALGIGVTGNGIRIGIVDTGVDYRHADLGGCLGATCRVRGGYDYVNGDSDPMDDQGHGTHVAGIAAGSGSLLKGVAPGALIYAYKVLSASGSGYTSAIVKSLDDAVDPNGDGNTSDRQVDVLNLSLGGYGNPDDPLSLAVDRAVAGGIVVVVAAGNSGPGQLTIGSPGTARRAITVGASNKITTSTAEGAIAQFSSRGPVAWNNLALSKPDIVAPGMSICATRSTSGQLSVGPSCAGSSTHISLSGTSMATPHVAGLAALIRQKNPTWTPDQIKAALMSSAVKVLGGPTTQGDGLVQGTAALSLASAPPVIYLEPLSYAPNGVNGVLPISARVLSSGLQYYKIETAPLSSFTGTGAQAAWTAWAGVNVTTRLNSDVPISLNLNLANLPDGEHSLRLTATATNGLVSRAYGAFKLRRITLVNPLVDDFIRIGSLLVPSIVSPITSGVPAYSFRKTGVTTWTPVTGAQWDTNGFEAGSYEFKAEMPLGGLIPQMTSDQVTVRLDSLLRAGFPVRMPIDNPAASGGQYTNAGRLDPIVADLTGDRRPEILIQKAGFPSKVIALKADGATLWVANLGVKRQFWDVDPPVVGVQSNGRAVVYAFSSGGNERFDNGDDFSEIYAFDGPTGAVLSGWPVRIAKRYDASLVVGRVLPSSSEYEQQLVLADTWIRKSSVDPKILVFGQQGKVLHEWALPQLTGYGLVTNPNTHPGPVLANLDADPELEIIYTWGRMPVSVSPRKFETYLEARNGDGTRFPGWPVKLPSMMMGPPVTGDLDGDGTTEIIAQTSNNEGSTGVLTVLGRDGSPKVGWPKTAYNGSWASPAVGDFDRDGKREIASCSFQATGGVSCAIYNLDGTLLPGWPKGFTGNNLRSVAIGDLDGDQYPDLAINTHAEYIPDEKRSLGRIHLLNRLGATIAGPAWLSMKSVASPVITDLDANGKTELVITTSGDEDPTRRLGIFVWNLLSPYSAQWTEWPTFGNSPSRDGRYLPMLTSFKYTPSPLAIRVGSSGSAFPAFTQPVTADVWKVSSGALPTGLQLNVMNGAITGTASAVTAPAYVTVVAKNHRSSYSSFAQVSTVASTAVSSACLGDCTPALKLIRRAGECFNSTDAANFTYVRDKAILNGSRCVDPTQLIVGFEVYRESGGCHRTDRFFCR